MDHLSQVSVPLLMLTQVFGLAGCTEKGQAPAPNSTTAWGQPVAGLRCTIDVGQSVLSKSADLIVAVRLQNVSSEKIERECIPAFDMANSWCPVDLSGLKGHLRERISLESGESVRFKANLSRLSWDHQISSVWPSREFHHVVSSGTHELQLKIELLGTAESEWLHSNTVNITISD